MGTFCRASTSLETKGRLVVVNRASDDWFITFTCVISTFRLFLLEQSTVIFYNSVLINFLHKVDRDISLHKIDNGSKNIPVIRVDAIANFPDNK